MSTKIGSDPEFILGINGRAVSAQEVIRDITQDEASKALNKVSKSGERALFIKNEDDTNCGEFGLDGHADTGELRPSVADTPEEHAKNIGKIIESFHSIRENAQMSTLSLYNSVGGHIHIDKQRPKFITMERYAILVSYCLLPLKLTENKISKKLREAGNGYGKITDFRTDNNYSIEIRTLSAEWITTPKLCIETLNYVKLLADNLLNIEEKDLPLIMQEDPGVISGICAKESSILIKALEQEVLGFVKKQPFYQENKDRLTWLFDAKEVEKEKSKANYDAVQGWLELKKERKTNKNNIMGIKAYKIEDFINNAEEKFKTKKLKYSYFVHDIEDKFNSPTVIREKTNSVLEKDEEMDSIYLEELMSKNKRRLNSIKEDKEIDLKTLKQEGLEKEIIMIGLPLRDRVVDNYKLLEDIINKTEQI